MRRMIYNLECRRITGSHRIRRILRNHTGASRTELGNDQRRLPRILILENEFLRTGRNRERSFAEGIPRKSQLRWFLGGNEGARSQQADN